MKDITERFKQIEDENRITSPCLNLYFARYIELNHLADIGLIIWHDKTPLQPKFKLEVNGKHICYYIADFRYYDVGDGKEIIEDVKGYKTAVYKLKKKLFLASYPEFEFIET